MDNECMAKKRMWAQHQFVVTYKNKKFSMSFCMSFVHFPCNFLIYTIYIEHFMKDTMHNCCPQWQRNSELGSTIFSTIHHHWTILKRQYDTPEYRAPPSKINRLFFGYAITTTSSVHTVNLAVTAKEWKILLDLMMSQLVSAFHIFIGFFRHLGDNIVVNI